MQRAWRAAPRAARGLPPWRWLAVALAIQCVYLVWQLHDFVLARARDAAAGERVRVDAPDDARRRPPARARRAPARTCGCSCASRRADARTGSSACRRSTFYWHAVNVITARRPPRPALAVPVTRTRLEILQWFAPLRRRRWRGPHSTSLGYGVERRRLSRRRRPVGRHVPPLQIVVAALAARSSSRPRRRRSSCSARRRSRSSTHRGPRGRMRFFAAGGAARQRRSSSSSSCSTASATVYQLPCAHDDAEPARRCSLALAVAPGRAGGRRAQASLRCNCAAATAQPARDCRIKGRRCSTSVRSPPTSTSAPATCRSTDSGAQPSRSRVLFGEGQIRAIVHYVASLGNGPTIPSPQWQTADVAAGKRLFTDNCAGCHQIVARGGYVTGARVPPLGQATPGRSPRRCASGRT